MLSFFLSPGSPYLSNALLSARDNQQRTDRSGRACARGGSPPHAVLPYAQSTNS